MAGLLISDRTRRCNTCVSRDQVSLTLEWCGRMGVPVLGTDAGCADHVDVMPWLAWPSSICNLGRAARGCADL